MIERQICGYNPTTFINVYCKITNMNRTTQAISIDAHIQPGVILRNLFVSENGWIVGEELSFELPNFDCVYSSNSIVLQIKVSLLLKPFKRSDYGIFRALSNYTIDVCKHVSGIKESIFINYFMSDLRKFSNVLHACPYSVYIINIGKLEMSAELKNSLSSYAPFSTIDIVSKH